MSVLRMLAWDGLLPLVVLVVPYLVRLVLPQFPDAIVVAAIVVSIVAFFLRVYIGCCYICANQCGKWLRRFQLLTLNLGVFTLMFVETLVMVLQDLPGNANVGIGLLIVLAPFYAFYIACMLITLYSGEIDSSSSRSSVAPSSNLTPGTPEQA